MITTEPEETSFSPSSEDSFLYISPVLAKLQAEDRPKDSPACETCPMSLWFTSKRQLECYCVRMHVVTWGKGQPPILQCDGREIALIELQQKQAGELTT